MQSNDNNPLFLIEDITIHMDYITIYITELTFQLYLFRY